MMRLAGRPRVMAVIGEPIWVMNPICFDARAAKAVRACIVTGRSSSPRSRNIPFFQVTYSGNQVALFVGTPIWTEVGVSVWAPYGKLNRKMIAADRLIICLIGLTSYPFCRAGRRSALAYATAERVDPEAARSDRSRTIPSGSESAY